MRSESFLKMIESAHIIKIAIEAGEAAMEIYEKDFTVEYKEDKSPLTEADRRAHKVIVDGLKKISLPAVRGGDERMASLPILSEEGRDIPYEVRRKWERYWCVDPIDGTKEFIKKSGEFTVNIALIHQRRPVFGVVYAPALKEIYWAKKGEGAWKAPVDDQGKIVDSKKEGLPLSLDEKTRKSGEFVIVASKSHLNAETRDFIERASRNKECVRSISKGSSLKLLMVAEGSADIYPRLGPTMEWDTAAADAIVRESGKKTYVYEKGVEEAAIDLQETKYRLLQYNKRDLLNPWFIVG